MDLVIGFLADILWGDPVYAYHPVRLMGKAIEKGEAFLRKHVADERFAGAILAVGLVLVVFLSVWLVLYAVWHIHPWLSTIVNILGIYTAISVKDLYQEARRIYEKLCAHDIEIARQNVGRIVGRDTDHLSEQEIIRATVETVAESSVDGIIAPIFYAALGGAPLALAYKAVNTLDSMIGYQNQRYRHFGFFAAKQDDAWNWLPARISYVVISLAALVTGKDFLGSLRLGWRFGMAAGYGNSAIPEACFAGALGVRLGGDNRYQGEKKLKPFLGVKKRELCGRHIMESLTLMFATGGVMVIFCSAWSLMKGVYFG